jgi:wyosine [tRNA(Phe)-imidazoG37] synthetase (radical SAM superfamily)
MQSTRNLDFGDHRRILWDNRYIYPVVSRRSKGLSIGVNLNPDKVCNFDCPYCQVDRTTPGGKRDVDLVVLESELDALLALAASGEIWEHKPFDTVAPHLRRVNDVAFAGDGEPTTCKQFQGALELVGTLLERHGLAQVKPIVLTNATVFHRPKVAQALDALDALGGQIWAKLDAGTEPYFHFVDGTTFPFSRVMKNLIAAAQARPIVLQSMFLRLWDLGPSDAEIQAYWDRITEILDAGGQIELVQVYSIARHPARPILRMLPDPELERIAAGVRALGVAAEIYSGREI